MIAYGILIAVFSTYVLFAAALCPGIAVLHFAHRNAWPILATLAGLLLLAAPIAFVMSEGGVIQAVTRGRQGPDPFVYALWFFPALAVFLNAPWREGQALGTIASLVYLLPYLVFTWASLLMVGFYAYPAYTTAAAVAVVVANRAGSLLVPARVLAVVLLLVPVASSLGYRLPAYLAMSRACESQAGMEIAATPAPVSTLAMDADARNYGDVHQRSGCSSDCLTLITSGQLEAVEAPVPGGTSMAEGSPVRLHRYELGALLDPGSDPSLAGEDRAVCERVINFKEGRRCLMASPVEGYSAPYIVRRIGEVHPTIGITQQSFEIVERRSGTVIAWTAAYYMPGSAWGRFLDTPLRPFIDRRGNCVNNGRNLKGFLEDFLAASRQ